jgi:hypothetical protein
MEITLSQNTPCITTEKKLVQFEDGILNIDGMTIDTPGEYEKSGVLVQTRNIGESLVHELQVERKIVGYIPASITEATEELIGFFDDLDVLLIAGAKEDIKIFESLEARVVVPYGENREQFLVNAGQSALEITEKYKSKESDFEGETTVFVRLA